MVTPAEQAPAAVLPMMGPINIKLPPFWASDPQIWFAQVEAQFATRRITSQSTKFSHVVAALQPEIAQEVRDLLLGPPADAPYDVLKDELTRRTSESEQRRLQMLLTELELGDRKPSQLLRKMRQLLGEHKLEEGILKQLFVQRLPANVQLILATSSTALSNEQLSDLADRIMDVPVPSVHVAHAPSPSDSAVADLKADIAALTEQVRSLQRQVRHSSRSRSRGPQGRSSPHPNSNAQTAHSGSDASQSDAAAGAQTSQCWYHETWGNKAHKCRPPCSFDTSSGNA